MRLPLYQVDAFADRRFAGNPAAVVLLEEWLDTDVLQAIALENNLSETAFLVRDGETFHIRWFTPTVEVKLCGHATLASAHVVLTHLEPAWTGVTFHSKSGDLGVTRDGDRIWLDFPAEEPTPGEVEEALFDAVGARPVETLAVSWYTLLVFDDERAVRDLVPDMGALVRLGRTVIATAPGDEHDFVSRFFGPTVGVDEDPVTGAAHCVLTPYWARRLGKSRLHARQVSARGGDIHCEHDGARVRLGGTAVDYLVGTITV